MNEIEEMKKLYDDFIKKAEEFKERIEELENNEKKEENNLWKPKEYEKYYYLSYGEVEYSAYAMEVDEDNYLIGNCFKTLEEAEKVKRHLITRAKLQRIADRLNKGQVIDWNDKNQYKYVLYYSNDKIETDYWFGVKFQGVIYCLDENFKDIAIQEIGQKELEEYLKGE